MRKRVLLATTTLLLAALPAAAADSELQKLEEAVQALQKEIAQLKARQAETEKQVQAQAPSPDLPKLIESPTHQFGLTSADGANSIALIARMQVDAADYIHVAPEGGAKGAGPGGTAGPLDSGINARRARLGIGGVFLSDWAYRLIYDFGSSSDSLTTGVSGAGTSGVENAYLTYNGFYKKSNALPIAIDIGYLDVPWTLDEATSSNDIMFLERASPQVVATQFGGGDFRSALGVRSNTSRFWAGLYLTGPLSGAPHTGAAEGNLSLLGRASYQLVQSDDWSLHVGANAGHLFNSRLNVSTIGTSSVKTTLGNQALALNDRPELRVDPTAILNTGNIPAHAGDVVGAETALAAGNFFAQGEYLHYRISQNAGGVNPSDGAVNLLNPDLDFQGGYVEASYSIGGRRRYIPETGAYSAVIPDHPFTLSNGGWGAFELAARFSAIDLNDKFTPGRATHLSGGVNGGDQKGLDVGLNWYPNLNVKFMLDYIHTDINNLFKPTTNGTASTTPAGAHVQAVAARSQVAF
jgi:phosphate-selective porin OprO/OprP